MNIALIAMSGVRAIDPELNALGMTLPGFVERGKVIASLPSLGLLTLAGMTPAAHRVRYIEVRDLRQHPELPTDVDLMAISSYTAQIRDAYRLADRCRRLDIPVVLGGPHVTVLPDEASEHADAVVIGEGEASWPDVLDDAARGRLAARYGSINGGFDLADAPTPAYELLEIDRYNRLTVQASRGCPHRCEFCASSVLISRRYRQKPIGNVLAEIDRIREIWPRPFIEFADDNAVVDRDYWKALARELRGRRIRWFAESDLSVSEDAELLDAMREAGCAQILIGFESPSPQALCGLELRSDWKRRKSTHHREAVRRIQSRGISVNGCFIVGLDGHGPEVFEQILDFVRETEMYEVQITLPTPFPGTPMRARLEREGRLFERDRWDTCTLFDLCFRPLGMTARQLTDGFKRLACELYGEDARRVRTRAFKRQLRHLSQERHEVTP